MAEYAQNYANHVRWHPIYHFILTPILLVHFIWCVARLIMEPNFDHAEQLLLSIGLLLMMLLVRVNPLKAQDRLIRLEEQLRYRNVLPADLAAKAAGLPVRYIVALRFAADEELAGLVKEALDGKYSRPKEVKRAIRNWRGDYFRV
jgi:hypothetical protein